MGEPVDFLQKLAVQNQLLSCLQWLGEFQVLVCIPLAGSVSFGDVAELTGVPQTQLCRVVRMTATAGFLSEPQRGYVAHTPLSGPFVTRPSFLDAAMFLAETAAPAALQMAAATQQFGNSQQPHESSYNLAFDTPITFASAYEQRAKLQRQWLAYLRYGMGHTDAGTAEVLTRLDWASLGSAGVVEVGAQSTLIAKTLGALNPTLHFTIQIAEPGTNFHLPRKSISSGSNLPAAPSASDGIPASGGPLPPREFSWWARPGITIQQRTPGTAQNISDAAVYIIHLPSPVPGVPSHSIPAQVVTELKAHIGMLHGNASAALVLTARLLPEPGTVDSNIESIERLRNLSLNQLANEQEIETLDLIDIINSVRDNMGRLVLMNELRSPNTSIVAFEVRYQAYGAHGFERPAFSNI